MDNDTRVYTTKNDLFFELEDCSFNDYDIEKKFLNLQIEKIENDGKQKRARDGSKSMLIRFL